MPKVSVVMSTYNDAQYLGESIDSILAQDFGDFEFVIINDGSSEPGTRNVLADYIRRDDRIRVIHKNNVGLTKALIDGCSVSTGEYIVRIDVGDVMMPDRLGKQMQVLEKNRDCVFVSCRTEFNGPNWETLWVKYGKPVSSIPVSILPEKYKEGLIGDISHHGSVMFRTATYRSVGGYRYQFYYGQDWDLWYRLAERGNYFVVPEILYRARIFPRSISMLNKKLQDGCADCSLGAFVARRRGDSEQPWLDKANNFRPSHDTSHRDSKHRKNNLEPGFYFVGEALRRNNDPKCRYYFGSAIRQNPLRMRSYIRLLQSFY